MLNYSYFNKIQIQIQYTFYFSYEKQILDG